MCTGVKVSVIIAVYNASQYLEECLNSVKKQFLKDIEIICVNDGSTDNSYDILKKYEKTDARFKVIDQENQGAGAARNRGLQEAKGEFLSFLDADDFFEPDMLEEAYRAIKVADADICVFGADLYVNDADIYKPCTWSFKKQYFPIGHSFVPSEEPYCENIFRMFNGWAWDKLFKRHFIEKSGIMYQNLRTTNDMYFVYSALAQAKKIITVDRILAHQRISITTSLSRTREKSWNCFYTALLALQSELKRVKLYDTYKKAFVNWALNFSLWQLKTMKGEAYEEAYELLHTVGWAKLDVAKYPRTFFFSQDEYQQLLQILTTPLHKE